VSLARLTTLSLLALSLTLTACTPKTRAPDPEIDPYALPGDVADRPDGVEHRVAAGESWESLAENFYGDSGRAGRLKRANRRLGLSLEVGGTVFVPMDDNERRAFRKRARARAPYNKGLEFARARRYPEAILQFEEAIRLDPRLARAHYNLGLVYRHGGRPALAAASLERACALKRRDGDYLYAWGAALSELGETQAAEKRYRRALDADPEHLPSLFALARALEDRGRKREAARYWSRYLKLEPDSARGREAARRLGLSP